VSEAAAAAIARFLQARTSRGIYLKVRLEQDNVCLLVIIGVRADGTNEPAALADGYRESSKSWANYYVAPSGSA
jgi:transposase-like protein